MSHTDIQTGQVQELQRWLDGDVLSTKAKHRLRSILHFYEHGLSMEETARLFQTKPNTLRRWLKKFDPTDPTSLEEHSRRPRTVPTSTVPVATVALIRDYRVRFPRMGKEEISTKLQQEHQLVVSASSVGRVIERECLYFGDSALHRRKRFQVAGASVVRVDTHTEETKQPIVAQDVFDMKKWFVRGAVAVAILCAAAVGYGTQSLRADITKQTPLQCVTQEKTDINTDSNAFQTLTRP